MGKAVTHNVNNFGEERDVSTDVRIRTTPLGASLINMSCLKAGMYV